MMRKLYHEPTAELVICAAQDILMISDDNASIGGGVELPPIGASSREDLPVINLSDWGAGREM